MTHRIPDEDLKAERLWFERHCAAVLAQCLADSGMDLDEVNARSGDDLPVYIVGLLRGNTGTGADLVDLSLALGVRMFLRAEPIPVPENTQEVEAEVESEADKDSWPIGAHISHIMSKLEAGKPLYVPSDFWSSQTTRGIAIDSRSVLMVLEALREHLEAGQGSEGQEG